MPAKEKTESVDNLEIILKEIKNVAEVKSEKITSTGMADAVRLATDYKDKLEDQMKTEHEISKAKEEKSQKIERSRKLNESRMKILVEKDKVLKDIVAKAEMKIIESLKDEQFKSKLYEGLIRESISTLRERMIYVKCRECDLTVVENIVKNLNSQFARKIQLKIYPERLPSMFVADGVISGCIGGISLMSRDKKIFVDNTINKRVVQAVHILTPFINREVFEDEQE